MVANDYADNKRIITEQNTKWSEMKNMHYSFCETFKAIKISNWVCDNKIKSKI